MRNGEREGIREIVRTGERERGRGTGRKSFEHVSLGVGGKKEGIREIVRNGDRERKSERVI